MTAFYLTVNTQKHPDLQNDFRLRAIWAQATLVPLAVIVFITSKYGAPLMYHGLTNWWAPVMLLWTGLSPVTATVAIGLRRFRLARMPPVAEVPLVLLGWGLAQFRHLSAPDV